MYKKIRFYTHFASALIKKYRFILVAGLALGTIAFIVVPPFLSYVPKLRGVTRVGYVGRYTISDLPLPIKQKLSLGLTTVDVSGLASPALASSWEATDSGKTYIFTINTDYQWQDGSQVKSSDIKFNFRDAAVEYPDESHLIIKLQDPFSPLPSIVSQPILKVKNGLSFFSPTKYYGVGSYRLSSYRKNGAYLDSLVLVPTNSKSALPKLRYQFYASQSQARTAFKLGLVDIVEDLLEIGELKDWPNVQIQPQAQADRYVAVFFNTQDPQLSGQSGKNLRLSLAYAIDKTRWPNRVYGPIPETSWAYTSDIRKYEQDMERAKSLLTKVEKIPDNFILTTVPAYLEIAEVIKKDWEDLGLKVEVQVSPEIPADYQALIVGQAIPTDPDQYNLWHSTRTGTNLTRLQAPRIDKKLEDGRKTFNIEERKAIYLDFQKTLLDEIPAVFLFSPQTYHISRD